MFGQIWFKMDNAFTEHEKFLRAGPHAGYLNIAAIAWANRNLTDGFIPEKQVERLVAWTGCAEQSGSVGDYAELWRDVSAEMLTARLLAVGLWEEVKGGYLVHDYLEWQRSAEEITELSAERAEAGRKGGHAKAAANKHISSKSLAKPQQTSSKSLADLDLEVNVLTPLSDKSDESLIFKTWIDATGRTGKTRFSAKRRRLARNALKDYPLSDCLDAVQGWRNSPHHRGENSQGVVYNDFELLLRDAEHIEKFRDLNRSAAGSRDPFMEAIKAREEKEKNDRS
jgi:hypothetical protein